MSCYNPCICARYQHEAMSQLEQAPSLRRLGNTGGVIDNANKRKIALMVIRERSRRNNVSHVSAQRSSIRPGSPPEPCQRVLPLFLRLFSVFQLLFKRERPTWLDPAFVRCSV